MRRLMLKSEVTSMSTTLFKELRSANLNFVTYKTVPPCLRELLAQGALAGVLAFFIITVCLSFRIDNYYKPLLFPALPQYLGMGLAVGLVNGFGVWCAGKYLADRPPAIARVAISIATVLIENVVFIFLDRTTDGKEDYVIRLSIYALIAILSLSLITGSHFRPWRALTHGLRRINSQQQFPATVAGFLLRVALLFLCLYSMFVFICLVEMNEDFVDFLVVGSVVLYSVFGLALALANARFWLTLVFAIVINAPWVYILIVYFDRFELNLFFVFYLSYPLLWLGFLVTHCPALRPAFSSLSEELRYYYLID
jgi:hypothetical protein